MNRKQLFFLLTLLIFIGTFLRFYKLGSIPDSLNWDEVSWGYNGFSIWETGRDEQGEFYPLSFKAFGDYKQPVYVYLNALSIGLLGLNRLAVRLPSALLGSLSIVVTFLFINELFYFAKQSYRTKLALVTAFLIAVSPWSVQFSRVAFEANVGQFFVLLSAWLFISGINRKNWTVLSLSTIPLAISAFSYHSEKLFSPLFFILLLLYGFPFLIKNKKKAIILVILFIVLNLPWILDARTTTRGRSVTFSSNQTQLLEDSVEKITYENQEGLIIGKIVYNRRIIYLKKFIQNYLLHFDPNYLFNEGDNARHHAPGMGNLYLISLPLIILGIREVVKMKNRAAFLSISWFLLAPAAAALAIDAPNASRSLIFLPLWQLFSAIGVIHLAIYLKGKKYFRHSMVVMLILFIVNILYFFHQYFVHTNTDMQTYWQYGYEQAVNAVKGQADVAIHFDETIEQGYIFYLFYSQYSPEKYIDNGGLNKIAEDCSSIENIRFGKCSNTIYSSGDMLITSKRIYNEDFIQVKTFITTDNQTTISVLKYGEKE